MYLKVADKIWINTDNVSSIFLKTSVTYFSKKAIWQEVRNGNMPVIPVWFDEYKPPKEEDYFELQFLMNNKMTYTVFLDGDVSPQIKEFLKTRGITIPVDV